MRQSANTVLQESSALWRLGRGYLQLVSNMGSSVLGGSLPILLGFSPLPTSFPLAAFARANPTVASVIGGVFVLLIAVAVTLSERRRLGRGAVRFLFFALLSALGSLAIGVLFGFNDLPSTIPLLSLIRDHPPLGIGLVGGLLAILIFAPLLGGDDEANRSRADITRADRRLFAATAVSTLSALLFVSLLTTVIFRPAWCPSELCPAVPTNPLGVHDANLEVFYTATQSSTYVIPGAVSQYSLGQHNLPRGASAIRIDKDYPPYRVVIGVHSLQRDVRAGLFIQQVTVVVDSVAVPPTPLNVWNPGPPNNFSSNPYRATYRGEPVGAQLIAFSTHEPPTYTDLREGESDEIDVQLASTAVASITFHIEVTYNVKGDATLHTLSLKAYSFTLVFAKAANWHAYQLGPDGHFVPAAS
jgi:hypothetical protein